MQKPTVLPVTEAPISHLLALTEALLKNVADSQPIKPRGSSSEYVFSSQELTELRLACDNASKAISEGFNAVSFGITSKSNAKTLPKQNKPNA